MGDELREQSWIFVMFILDRIENSTLSNVFFVILHVKLQINTEISRQN